MSFRVSVGRILGRCLQYFGFRRAVVLQNIEICFPDWPPAKRADLVKSAYQHLGFLVLEILKLFWGMPRFIRSHSKLLGWDYWKKAKDQGRGVIHLASHVGNWEVMAATGAYFGKIDILLVTKHLKPEWLHRRVEAGRSACGVKATYEPRTLRTILSHLKKGGTVGIVLDQYTGPPVGIRVPFFGLNVGTHSLVAMLAKRTGAPVVPVTNRRLPNGDFEVEIRPQLEWITNQDPLRELELNTEQYARVVESMVRENPTQWLWTHRRFKGNLGPITDEERQRSRRHRQF